MLKEYDIDKLNPRSNPYAKELKRQVVIDVDNKTLDFFKTRAEEAGIPYQVLMSLYLKDCADNDRRLKTS